jgi:hypothetical protein
MAVFPHPPYSPDLAPCDFFIFPKMKIEAEKTLIVEIRLNCRECLTI